MVPQVDSPELSHAYADKFISISVLRKVAHIHKRDDTVATDHVNVYTTKGTKIKRSRGSCLTQKILNKKPKKGSKNAKFITKTKIVKASSNSSILHNCPRKKIILIKSW
nr:nucleosome assembly protein 1;4-like [Tanacetum cinerariifolium]